MDKAPTQGGSVFRVTESQLQHAEAEEKTRADAEKAQSKPVALNLALYVKQSFSAAKAAAEQEFHERLLRCLRQKNGEYDPDILAKIRSAIPGGSENYRNITQIKSKAFEAWCEASVFPVGGRCWAIKPSPDPELAAQDNEEIEEIVGLESETLMAENGIESVPLSKIKDRITEVEDNVKREKVKKAKAAAVRVENAINDQLVEGHYYDALSEAILDMSVYPVCWVTGPEIRKRKKFKWVTDEEGKSTMTVIDKLVREYRRVSPFNIFPSPNSKNPQDGYLCELIDLKRSELAAMIGVDGFDEVSIRAVLQEYGEGGLRQWVASDTERKEAENKPRADEDPNPPIQAVVFWGECQGSMLREWGMTKEEVPDLDIDYQISAWLIGTYIVMARLNPSPLGNKPYYCASFDEVNDSIPGNAIPEVMRDDQMRCCAAARAIDNNMAMSSGPMFEFYKNRFEPGTNFATLIKPWGWFPTQDDMQGTNNPAVRIHIIPNVVDDLLKVDEYFLRQAGEKTIPSYVYGNAGDSKSGALSTASGTSMMLNSSLKNISGAIKHLEKGVIIPSIKEHWAHVMLYDDDVEKFGDAEIEAMASEHLVVEEQRQMRARELLATADGSDSIKGLIGEKGFATLLREVVKITKIDPAEIVPTEQEMDRRELATQAQVTVPEVDAQGKPVKSATQSQDGGDAGKPPGDLAA